MRAERPLRYRRAALLGPALAMALAAASCTAGTAGTEERKAGAVPATALCGSSLDADARRAVARLSGKSALLERRGVPWDRAASRLRRRADVPTTRTELCRVYRPADSAADALFTVEFARLDPLMDWPDRLPADTDSSRVGVYGASSGRGAEIVFRCAEGLPRNGPPFLMAALSLPGFHRTEGAGGRSELPAAEQGRAGMAVLRSVARALAGKLGCAEEAAIPARPPRPRPSTAYRGPSHPLKDWRWWWKHPA
ncbi:hypothetical protein [Streptomyces sp. NPDC048636]|uniref:hypothetical protein n=1 Tax=Streptomyces sp. NPDC048636 TaxID=3155762 RepID=UPI0034284A73